MAEPCSCDACVADPGWTCSYTRDDVTIQAVYVANAYRGNLILCPGGANGQIGGLLHQLDPPQHYSHMGIVVADYDLIRNCTASPSRMTSDEYYSGSVLGVSAPVDGLDVDHVQYGWPGSVTQSAEQIFFADRYGDALTPPGLDAPYHGADLVDKESPSGKAFAIAAMSFDGVWDDGTWIPALVVKPCPLLETPEVRAAIERIADEAMKIDAHYRFYCYSDGAIGNDPNYLGPATEVPAAQPDWDPASMKWVDWSDPATVHWKKVPATIPAVCSSFVWHAIQNANKAASPKLTLDWAETPAEALGEKGGACRRAMPPDWTADTRDPYTLDGLYTYDEESRKRAGDWLNDSLADEVFTSLKSALADKGGLGKALADALDTVGRPSFIAAASGGAGGLLALLTPVVGPVVAPALTSYVATQLIELLYDMPTDIANQVCNSFAFDCHRGFPGDTHCVDANGNEIRDIDSTNWSDAPGVGRAVSPDNVHMFWDAPGPSEPAQELRGIYGYNAAVQPVVAAVRRPRCELVPSTGVATIEGGVLYRGERLAGAKVRVNCQKTVTNLDSGYRFTVRSGGHYKVIARYEDPRSGKTLYGEATTSRPPDPPVADGDVVDLDIKLLEPPTCLRNIVVDGVVRVDDVYLTGADHAETQFTKTLYVQYGVASFNEQSGQWDIDPNDPVAKARQRDLALVSASVGDSNGQLKIEVTANPDLSVDVTFTGSIENLSHSTNPVHVPDGATVGVPEFDLDTGGPFNDRAYFRNLAITNLPTQAI